MKKQENELKVREKFKRKLQIFNKMFHMKHLSSTDVESQSSEIREDTNYATKNNRLVSTVSSLGLPSSNSLKQLQLQEDKLMQKMPLLLF